MGKFNGISIHSKGDVIKVKIVDTSYNIYFKGQADINNPEQMKKLKEELREKGVPI